MKHMLCSTAGVQSLNRAGVAFMFSIEDKTLRKFP